VKFANIVVLTGAGISAESGLQTFRDHDGLWENHRLEDVATPEAFAHDPELVYRFYNLRRAQLKSPVVQPNAAHKALARLEKCHPGKVLIVTQNVDDLHERAGSKNVLHMHGQLLAGRCCVSHKSFFIQDDFDQNSLCPCCHPGNPIRPDIVWFTEIPKYMSEIKQALFQADLFISIGTSGSVYPAADFVRQAKQFGAHTVELNLEESMGGNVFSECNYGLASEIVPRYIAHLLKG
jgi:NAD-dependent deacetylase